MLRCDTAELWSGEQRFCSHPLHLLCRDSMDATPRLCITLPSLSPLARCSHNRNAAGNTERIISTCTTQHKHPRSSVLNLSARKTSSLFNAAVKKMVCKTIILNFQFHFFSSGKKNKIINLPISCLLTSPPEALDGQHSLVPGRSVWSQSSSLSCHSWVKAEEEKQGHQAVMSG